MMKKSLSFLLRRGLPIVTSLLCISSALEAQTTQSKDNTKQRQQKAKTTKSKDNKKQRQQKA
jgi:hypothetical protein